VTDVGLDTFVGRVVSSVPAEEVDTFVGRVFSSVPAEEVDTFVSTPEEVDTVVDAEVSTPDIDTLVESVSADADTETGASAITRGVEGALEVVFLEEPIVINYFLFVMKQIVNKYQMQ
jgi:hypothetical protein